MDTAFYMCRHRVQFCGGGRQALQGCCSLCYSFAGGQELCGYWYRTPCCGRGKSAFTLREESNFKACWLD